MNEAIVVLALTLFAFAFARKHLTTVGYSADDYLGRCSVWLLISAAAFFVGSFWVYLIISCAVLAFYSGKDSNPLALFCFLLFAVPNIQMVVPGPGPIDTLIEINYYRLLSLFLLLPLAWREFNESAVKRRNLRLPDTLIALFLIWMVSASGVDSGSITISFRITIYAITDVVLPYYVASRCINRMDQFNDIAAAFVAALFVLGLIALFESARTWLLYEALKYKWGDVVFQGFQMRGVLRATASSSSPITLGFSMVVGLGFAYLLRSESSKKWHNTAIMLVLLGGLLGTVSRGPWVGALAMVAGIAMLGPGKFKRLALFSVAAGILLVLVLVSPYGDTFVSFLPWIGTGATNTVTFRELLLQDSLVVIAENPWFGDLNFANHPLMIKQANMNGGFLDIANAYLGYTLLYGLFSLSMFVLVIISTLLRLRWVVNNTPKNASQISNAARVMFGLMCGTVLILGTASIDSKMATIFWITIGLTSALYRMAEDVGAGAAVKEPIDHLRQPDYVDHNINKQNAKH